MAARAPLFGQEGKLGSKNSLAGLLAFPLDPRERHRRSRLSDLVSSFGRSRVKTRGWFVVIATPTVVFGCLFFDLLSHCRQAGGMKQRTQFFGSKWRFCGFMNGRGLQSEIWREEIPQASQSTSELAKGPKLLSTLGLGRCVVLWLRRRKKTRSGRVGVGA